MTDDTNQTPGGPADDTGVTNHSPIVVLDEQPESLSLTTQRQADEITRLNQRIRELQEELLNLGIFAATLDTRPVPDEKVDTLRGALAEVDILRRRLLDMVERRMAAEEAGTP